MKYLSYAVAFAGVALLAGCEPAVKIRKDADDRLRKPSVEEAAKESGDYETPGESAGRQREAPQPLTSVLRVNAVMQDYNHLQPWDKLAPRGANGLGAVLEGNLVLTTAEMTANATLIEFASADGTQTFPARVVAADYDCNLALLAPATEQARELFKGLVPLPLGTTIQRGSEVSVWQIAGSGMPLETPGKVQSIEMETTSPAGGSFLTYAVKASLQNVMSSYTLPVVNQGSLVGILTSYDSGDQLSQVISLPVIRRFLEDAADGKYEGFSVFGIRVADTVDPAFREWLKLGKGQPGQYVGYVFPGSPAEKAGVREGDVLVSLGGHEIDARGFYHHPDYGRMELGQIVRELKIGEKLPVKVWRDGHEVELEAEVQPYGDEDGLVPERVVNAAPKYMIYGGMVFQELTMPFLRSFGRDWNKNAPRKLMGIAQNPEPYRKKGVKRVVFVSRVVPTPATLGYEKLAGAIVTGVNGVPVKDLESLAEAIDSQKGVLRVSLEDAPYDIYIDSSQVDRIHAKMEAEPGFPALRQLK